MSTKILDKIQKLLRLAADNPESHESKLAAERAAMLMAKHNVGLEDVKEDGTMDDSAMHSEDITANAQHHQVWESSLAGILCDVFDCKRIISGSHKQKVRRFIGAKSDVVMLVNFYKYLRIKIARESETTYRLQKDQKMFGFGVVESLTPRLTEMYKKKEEVSTVHTRSLVVSKQLAVNNYFDRKYKGKLSRARAHTLGGGSADAYQSGRVVGNNLSLNRQIS